MLLIVCAEVVSSLWLDVSLYVLGVVSERVWYVVRDGEYFREVESGRGSNLEWMRRWR